MANEIRPFTPPMGAGTPAELLRLLTPETSEGSLGAAMARAGVQFPAYIPPHMLFSDEPPQAAQGGQPATQGGFGYRHPKIATALENALIGASIPTGVTTGENIANVIGGLRNIPLTRRQWQMAHLYAPLQIMQELEQGVLSPQRTSQGALARGLGVQAHGLGYEQSVAPAIAQRAGGQAALDIARTNAINQQTGIQAQQYNYDPLLYGVKSPLELFARSPQLAQDFFSAQNLGRRAYEDRPSAIEELFRLTNTPEGMQRYRDLFPVRTGTAPMTPAQRSSLEKWRATQLGHLQEMISMGLVGVGKNDPSANAIYNLVQDAYQKTQNSFGGTPAQPGNPLLGSPTPGAPAPFLEEDPLGFFNQ